MCLCTFGLLFIHLFTALLLLLLLLLLLPLHVTKVALAALWDAATRDVMCRFEEI